METRRKSIYFLILCGFVTTVVLLEVCTRLLHPVGWEPLSADALYYKTSGGFRLQPDRVVAATSGSISGRHTIVRTNSLGLRGPEPAANNIPKILFLGDSIFFADYIAEEETVVHLLNNDLNDSPAAFQVINAGISSQGIAQEIALLKELLEKIKIQSVVLGFFLNDAAGCCIPEYIDAPWPLSMSRFVQIFLHTYAIRNERFETFPGDLPSEIREESKQELDSLMLNANSNEQATFYKKARREFMPWGVSFSPSTWNYYREQFAALKKLQNRFGFSLKLIAFPVYDQTQTRSNFNYPQKQLGEIAKLNGWPFLDILPVLRNLPASTVREYLYDHCHYTPKGHVLLEQTLKPFLFSSTPGATSLEHFPQTEKPVQSS